MPEIPINPQNDTEEAMKEEMEQESGNNFWDQLDENDRAGWEHDLINRFEE